MEYWGIPMSGGFTESALVKKLALLNDSSQSIQTLSLWLIHHSKHCGTVVKIWLQELIKANKIRKLAFMYLANDVIQNSRKKGTSYDQQFAKPLKKAFEHLRTCDEDTKNNAERLLNIWEERDIYDSLVLMEFKRALHLDEAQKSKAMHSGENNNINATAVVDFTLEPRFPLNPQAPPGGPPELDDVVATIQEVERNGASADAKVREQIALLPKEVYDMAMIAKIQDQETAAKFARQVNEAIFLLSPFNTRLGREMTCRRRLVDMLKRSLQVQEAMQAAAETLYEESEDLLSKVYVVQHTLDAYVKKLPDFTHGYGHFPSE